MRLGINARHLVSPEIRGITRYTICLLEHLSKMNGLELYLFTDVPIHPVFRNRFPHTEVCFQSRREIFWEQWALPRKLREHRIDVFHAPANRGLPYLKVCPQVLTLHDIVETMPEFHARGGLKDRLRLAYADFASIRSANHILTVSQHSKRDICRHHRISPARVTVTYEACEERFYRRVSESEKNGVRRKYRLPEEFLLYLGGFDKKKNVENLIRGYAIARSSILPLVLAGEKKWEAKFLEELTRTLHCHDQIHFAGQVADEDLPALYQCATALIYPSLYEGFGLQLVEAMASGLPVLCSDRTSLPEIAGEAAVLFNPARPESISKAIQSFYQSPAQSNRAERSYQRAETFSWEKTADQTLAVYNRLLAESRRLA